MKKMNWIVALNVVVVLLAAVLGSLLGWRVCRSMADDEASDTALAQQMMTTGLCANALNLLSEDRGDRAVFLLEEGLGTSVQHAEDLFEGGAALEGVAAANLADSLRRAEEYYATIEDTVLLERVTALREKIRGED